MAHSSYSTRRRLGPYLLVLPPFVLFAVLFIGPMLRAMYLSLRTNEQTYGLEWYARSLKPTFVEDLLFTLGLGVATAIICLLVSLPIAFLLRRPFRGKRILNLLILFPLVVPGILAGYVVWLSLLRSGPIFSLLVGTLGLLPEAPMLTNDWKGLLIAMVWKNFPVATLTVSAALEGLDPSMGEAARDLGAGLWRRLREILLPMLMPGLLSGFVLVFIFSTIQFDITLIMGTGRRISTIPMDIFRETVLTQKYEFASALGIVLTLATLLLLGVVTAGIRGIYREAITG